MQDLTKIENENLQAMDAYSDAYADAPTSCITRDFATNFTTLLKSKMICEAGAWFEDSGMVDLLSDADRKECFKLLHDHLHDACGDMPIWDIVKRGGGVRWIG